MLFIYLAVRTSIFVFRRCSRKAFSLRCRSRRTSAPQRYFRKNSLKMPEDHRSLRNSSDCVLLGDRTVFDNLFHNADCTSSDNTSLTIDCSHLSLCPAVSESQLVGVLAFASSGVLFEFLGAFHKTASTPHQGFLRFRMPLQPRLQTSNKTPGLGMRNPLPSSKLLRFAHLPKCFEKVFPKHWLQGTQLE